MKYLFSIFLALCLATAHAEKQKGFTLQINGDQLIHNQADWQYATETSSYTLFVEKGMIGHKDETVEFHSYMEYKKPYKYDAIEQKIKRIYNYGILNCSQAKLYLLVDLYTDEQDIIRYRAGFDFGQYVSDLDEPNTARNDVYNLICKELI